MVQVMMDTIRTAKSMEGENISGMIRILMKVIGLIIKLLDMYYRSLHISGYIFVG